MRIPIELGWGSTANMAIIRHIALNLLKVMHLIVRIQ